MRRLALLVLLVAVAGCETTSPPAEDPEMELYRSREASSVRRVLVLPFAPETEFPDQAPMVTARFVQALRRGTFTVLPLPDEELTAALAEDVRLRGTIRAEDLVELEREYRADAVIIGTITRFDPYAPQELGLDIKAVSTRTGAVLWSAERLFSASSHSVAEDALAWYDRYIEKTGSEFGPEVVLLSPKAFARYACSRITDPLVGERTVARR
jgi:hypothetical protein